jgi:hypothetical protein
MLLTSYPQFCKRVPEIFPHTSFRSRKRALFTARPNVRKIFSHRYSLLYKFLSAIVLYKAEARPLLFSPGFATFFLVSSAKKTPEEGLFDKISTCRRDFFRKTVFTNGEDYGKVVPFFFAKR